MALRDCSVRRTIVYLDRVAIPRGTTVQFTPFLALKEGFSGSSAELS
jgi:hypothetical protein